MASEDKTPRGKKKRKFRKVTPTEATLLAGRPTLRAYAIIEKAGIYPKFSKRERAIIAALAPLIAAPPAGRGRPKGDGAPIQDAMQSFGVANQHFARNGGKITKAYLAAGEELGRSEHTIKAHFRAAKKYFAEQGHPLRDNHLVGLPLGNDAEPGSVEYWQIFLDQHYRKDDRPNKDKASHRE